MVGSYVVPWFVPRTRGTVRSTKSECPGSLKRLSGLYTIRERRRTDNETSFSPNIVNRGENPATDCSPSLQVDPIHNRNVIVQ